MQRYGYSGYNGQRGWRRRRPRWLMIILAAVVVIVVAILLLQPSSSADKPDTTNASGVPSIPDTTVPFFEELPQQKRIVIDPGHGGVDSPGCVYGGVLESHINLAIALKLKPLLEEEGYSVIMIREADIGVSIQERADIAAAANADIFISIHQNALDNDTVTNGIETWYHPSVNEDSALLATVLQNAVSLTTEARNRGIISSETLIVTREVKIPSCLIEAGFMSSDAERAKLVSSDYQDKIAAGIALGVVEYFEILEERAAHEEEKNKETPINNPVNN